tara:strand:+ start:964 stop:1389 length:426 start_codon:yes stop_codon:yes gene_type:complete
MKKLLYLLFAITLLGCDKSENEINDNSIIGKWYFIKEEHYENNVITEVINIKENEINGCRSYKDYKSDGIYEYGAVFTDCSGFDGNVFGNWVLNDNSKTVQMYNQNGLNYEEEILFLDKDKLTLQFKDGVEKQISYLEKKF